MLDKIQNMSLQEKNCLKSVCIRSFSSLYFPTFGLNTEIYTVNTRIQFEWEKAETKKLQKQTIFTPSKRFHLAKIFAFKIFALNME